MESLSQQQLPFKYCLSQQLNTCLKWLGYAGLVCSTLSHPMLNIGEELRVQAGPRVYSLKVHG